jgi:hypothetical protein
MIEHSAALVIEMTRVLTLGAAGQDFHNLNV